MADDGLPEDEGLWEDDEDEDDDFKASDEGSDSDGGSGSEEEKPKKGKAAPKSAPKASKKKVKKAAKADKRKRKPAFVEEEAEEEDDEDDDDDDEEEDGGGGRGGGGERRGAKRRRRGIGAQFIDEMAAVDDEDEEEEAEDDMEELINDKDEEVGAEELEAGQAAAAYRAVNRQADDRTEEELAKYIEERYRNMEDDEYEAADFDGDSLAQEALLPTASDPRLWVVQCRPGHEREAVMQLLQKAYTLADRGTPLAIRSAACHDHLKGYFYVEADKESHVMDAIRGLRTMFFSKGAKMVPLKEMPDALTVPRSSRAAEVVRDGWVRVKHGLYKDDLAKVLDVDYATSKAVVQVVPRIDLKAIKARQEGKDGGGGRGNFAPRPESAPTSAPPTPNARPLSHPDSMSGIAAALPEAAARRAVFVPGDRVVVVSGDLVNLEAVVTKVDEGEGGLVHVRSVAGDGVEELELPLAPHEIAKAFRVGDHVRALSGAHKGETGLVVSVDRGVVAVVSDATRAQFRVNARDLTEAVDAAPGLEVLGDKYQLHDLVQLDAQTAGVIIAVERGAARVLTNQGSAAAPDVRVCRVGDIARKLLAARATTVDKGGATIGVGEAVEVVEGELRGKKGTVHAIARGHVFLKLPDAPDKSLSGFVCVRSIGVASRAGAAAAAAAAAGAGGAQQQQQQDRGAAPGGFSGRGMGPAGGGGFGGRGRGRGAGGGMAGMELRVQGGPYSGYKGRVLQETPTHVRLELDAINRIVTVERKYVQGSQVGGAMGRGFAPPGVGRGYPGPGMGRGFAPGELPAPGAVPRTPAHPAQTPLHPSMTPRHPSMTPLHPGVMSTPAHPSFGMRTPAHHSMGGGDELGYGSYGGGGYGAYSAPTPGGGGGGGGYGSYSAPTPGTAETPGGAFGDVAPTPGIAPTPGLDGGYPSAPTPGGHHLGPAPTPGGGLAAPTPGGEGFFPAPTPGGGLGPAPTPGGGGVAFTPGYSAPTPGGAMLAHTPGPPDGGLGGGGADADPDAPDYAGVLVRLPGGGIGVGRAWIPGVGLEAEPLGGGAPVALEVIELVKASRQDLVKVVGGPAKGATGRLISIEGSDAVLEKGTLAEVSYIGKLADQEGEGGV
ncbi:hypothetical protein Rsub_11792 [Raphidocelis subcapitata]|uniref:Transcription elongation factor SPT5 n=1 Tax=Raphidocelis subcapitata TaxID=307507 RepID=A0A2V0PP83_9CHLO|nr:hypothetical protein Rsub_11792 [Raphidocelis subcapitata]|eukprot:GBF99267.1 hypothetical protein Rsub_11792 [Raphidocelis subcapitata]